MTDKVTIKIPRLLYEKLKQIIQGTSYSSVTEFVKNPKIPRWSWIPPKKDRRSIKWQKLSS